MSDDKKIQLGRESVYAIAKYLIEKMVYNEDLKMYVLPSEYATMSCDSYIMILAKKELNIK